MWRLRDTARSGPRCSRCKGRGCDRCCVRNAAADASGTGGGKAASERELGELAVGERFVRHFPGYGPYTGHVTHGPNADGMFFVKWEPSSGDDRWYSRRQLERFTGRAPLVPTEGGGWTAGGEGIQRLAATLADKLGGEAADWYARMQDWEWSQKLSATTRLPVGPKLFRQRGGQTIAGIKAMVEHIRLNPPSSAVV